MQPIPTKKSLDGASWPETVSEHHPLEEDVEEVKNEEEVTEANTEKELNEQKTDKETTDKEVPAKSTKKENKNEFWIEG